MDAFGWKLGQNVTMQGTIFPGDWTFTIRGIYHPSLKEYGDDSFMFHYDYLYEKYPDRVTPGWFIMKPIGGPVVQGGQVQAFKTARRAMRAADSIICIPKKRRSLHRHSL